MISLSSFEAYGITVAEALASGLQVIVNKNGALEEFVDGTTCIGIEPSAKNVIGAIRLLKPSQSYQKRIIDWNEVGERTVKTYIKD